MTTILRPLMVAYASLSVLIPAAGLPWPVLLPACLLALLAIGELWVRAVTGAPVETGIPAVRPGLVVLAGLLTLPAVALLLHPLGIRVAAGPLIIGAALVATVLGLVALLRLRRGAGWTEREPGPGRPDGWPGLDGAGFRGAPFAGASRGGLPEPGGRVAVRTAAAVLVPIVLSLLGGGVAIRAVERGARPELPGYLTVALNGWAAGISHPVAVPAGGLAVPVRVTNSGLPTTTQWLRLRVGGALVAARPVTVVTGKVYALSVQVPALPADGCLRPVGISVGGASTVFYARSGPAPAVRGRAC
ncbi:hypothetical protein GCM10010168_65260 [Actinoplanes ianthinogenes]|uniref:Uncharacterized protein n=1 Tax=Actinoplanes ianthinogenes TaxID=122358 RepID=A0ABM7LS65_9ACTN|nr:hypothetical protein [Actinoplanes ianthinogenes]BCJ42096.1 hypothetical protein Aiant_27530 [Actinoplanes ianthinogenes]GGR37706.1 hypothetical protein GCM10010168_65260 [Actinoplanes ianthinogenes]